MINNRIIRIGSGSTISDLTANAVDLINNIKSTEIGTTVDFILFNNTNNLSS
jgi:hypothetical protein